MEGVIELVLWERAVLLLFNDTCGRRCHRAIRANFTDINQRCGYIPYADDIMICAKWDWWPTDDTV